MNTRLDAERILDKLSDEGDYSGMPVLARRLCVLLDPCIESETPLVLESLAIFLRTRAAQMEKQTDANAKVKDIRHAAGLLADIAQDARPPEDEE